MKHTRIIAIAAVASALALSGSALAQGRGPGQGGGMGSGGMGPGAGMDQRGPGGGAGEIRVAPDGKAVYVQRTVTTSGSTTTVSEQLVAVGTDGKKAWAWTPTAAVREIAFPTGLVAVSAVVPASTSGTTTTPASSQLVGLNSATGVALWTKSVDGMIGDLEVTPSGGLLAVVSTVTAAGTSTTQATVAHALVSINLASGAIAWSYSLD